MKRKVDVIIMETGEVLEGVNITTAQDKANYQRFLERRENWRLKCVEFETTYREYGSFVWLLYNAGCALDLGIQPEDITKLIFISTYLNYQNRLMYKEDELMTKETMEEVLAVSESTFKRFWKSITDAGLLTVSDKGELFLNMDIFKRGKIAGDEDKDRMRIYKTGIRCLYWDSNVTQHKLLSYLFQLIPFVNINYNIVAYNPKETSLKAVEPMTMPEICMLVGYKPDNYRRLKNTLKALRIKGMPVFSFVENANGMFCYINPRVYYAGNQWKRVEVLGKFCEPKSVNVKKTNKDMLKEFLGDEYSKYYE